MNRKLLIVLAALAISILALSACGDDDDETTTDAATTEETTETTDTTEASGGGNNGGGDGQGGTIEPVADPSGSLEYETGTLEAPAGEVAIEFDNPSSVPHDVNIETPDGETIGGTEVVTGESTSATVEVSEPGTYTYYCSVGGHRAAGMEETLQVK